MEMGRDIWERPEVFAFNDDERKGQ